MTAERATPDLVAPGLVAPGLVALGRIGRPHGVHGELRVTRYNPSSTSLAPGRSVLIGGVRHVITAARPAGDVLVVALAGVSTREAAAAMTGAEVGVPRDELPPLEPGELYLSDLVGCACFEDASSLGVVVGVATYPASVCLVVESDEGTREIPVSSPYFAGVDLVARRVAIAHANDFPVEPRRARKPEPAP